ncbi:MAG: RagB/SusD family nutrient uptake outer membrane protein, partial [Ferruginibacter sp.]
LFAAPMIPGHASGLAALALKSRVLLYAASDLHDLSRASSMSSLIASFPNDSLICYTTGTRSARLQAAQKAAYAVLNAGYGGYMLNLSTPASKENAIFNSLAISSGGKFLITSTLNQELIFAKYFSFDKDEPANHVGLYNGPNGYHNKANNTPTGLLADDYDMIDGSKFSWTNPLNKANPFVNRDPRFYASILYDGAPWKPRDLVGVNSDPANSIQTGEYETGSGMIAGLDTRQSSIDGQNGSWTGYYMRKFTDPSFSIIDQTDRQFYPWPFIRMTEIVLNYAEASFELGQDEDAKAWINKVRFRAGMPANFYVTRASLRNERRIELAFEEHRYHDARRWMIAPAVLGRSLTYIKVTAKLKPGAFAFKPYRYDQNTYSYTYSPVVDNSQENRVWNDKMYYLPISVSELAKNKKLIQNPGY